MGTRLAISLSLTSYLSQIYGDLFSFSLHDAEICAEIRQSGQVCYAKSMKQPKPFFRKQTQSWYVQVGKKQHNLGKDETEAWKKYHKIMSQRTSATLQGSPGLVAECLDKYWQHVQSELAATTLNRRKPVLRSFGTYVGRLHLDDLRPSHVLDWIQTCYPGAGMTYRNTLMATIKIWSAWAVRMGYILADPLIGLKKPRPKMRQDFLPKERWPELLDHCGPAGSPFRNLVEFALECGVRAEEVPRLVVENLDLTNQRFVFPVADSKGRRRSRVIYLSSRAVEIVNVIKPPSGHIFVNSRGKPWNKNSINCRFQRLKSKMGLPWLCFTSLRHSFCHYRLSSGQDGTTVAKLMGHCDTRMVSSRYGHLEQNVEYMQRAANLATSTDPT